MKKRVEYSYTVFNTAFWARGERGGMRCDGKALAAKKGGKRRNV